jgi:Cof subfamily protein (haloacid dehalogenase superfamily)
VIRLLALDIDGTLLRSDKTISARTFDAVAQARSHGVRLVLVTGRRYPSARRVADQLGGIVPLVLHNGALVMEDGSVLRCRPLTATVARLAIEVGRGFGAEPVVHCGLNGEGRLLVDADARRAGLVGYYLERSAGDVQALRPLESVLETERPIQVMFGGTRAEMGALLTPLAARLGAQARIERTVYPATDLVLLDVIDPAVGKAEALAFLQARWGVTPGETLAIGDNWNDREMVAGAGIGFVMANADPELLALGLPVLPSNDEDGVALAIQEHVLGRRAAGVTSGTA